METKQLRKLSFIVASTIGMLSIVFALHSKDVIACYAVNGGLSDADGISCNGYGGSAPGGSITVNGDTQSNLGTPLPSGLACAGSNQVLYNGTCSAPMSLDVVPIGSAVGGLGGMIGSSFVNNVVYAVNFTNNLIATVNAGLGYTGGNIWTTLLGTAP